MTLAPCCAIGLWYILLNQGLLFLYFPLATNEGRWPIYVLLHAVNLYVADGESAGPLGGGGEGDEWVLIMGREIGSSALEGLHLETEASGRICIVLSFELLEGLAVCICISLYVGVYLLIFRNLEKASPGGSQVRVW